ncbi:MAG: hypothetical protein NWE75_05410 [Candidatus Bathyarchaeota archaeon]|jgi:hypothetical protein|nr:hypothetical protein [Candidatus Bathyarchaeota archaeon]
MNLITSLSSFPRSNSSDNCYAIVTRALVEESKKELKAIEEMSDDSGKSSK